MKKFLSAAVVLAAFAATHAQAQVAYDESRIRQSDQQAQVTGFAGGYLIFTISGYLTDAVSSPFFNGSLGQLINTSYRWDVVYHSGGQVSVRLGVPNAQRGWDNATVAVMRGGADVDRDRIRVW